MSHPLKHFKPTTDESKLSPLVLSVGIPPACVNSLGAELLSVSGSGRNALAALKLMRFNWLLTTMDLPDMRPWVLFERARRAQARLQCTGGRPGDAGRGAACACGRGGDFFAMR